MFLIEKRILSFKLISSLRYALKFKKWPDFNSPRDLNEKVMWLSFYSDTSLWSKLADKIEVRRGMKRSKRITTKTFRRMGPCG